MRKLTLCVMLLMLTSCALIERGAVGTVDLAAVATNQSLDTMAAPIAALVEHWCALFEYRQKHLGGLVNGMLAAQKKGIYIDCDTDTSETRSSIFE